MNELPAQQYPARRKFIFLLIGFFVGLLCTIGVVILHANWRSGEFQGYLPQNDLERQVSIQLVKMSGKAPTAVHCAGPLEKLEGKMQHCTVVKGVHSAGLTAIASDIREDDASCRISLMADEPIDRPDDD